MGLHRTDLGTTSRSEEIHESGSIHQGLSRMKGNFHVRFLGGWGQATVPGYPRAGRAGHMAKGGRWSDDRGVEVRDMRDAETTLAIIRERGKRGLHLEDVYRRLYNPDLYLRAYGRIYTAAL